jgi:hypothetical protein
MNVLVSHHGRVRALAGMSRRFLAAVFVATAGCEHPFEPFQENPDAIFSMFGYLDLNADTQWVRVMPIRQDLFLDPDPIDAVVTLEHLGSGRTVTLNDSLFTFADQQLDAVAYAYNFWTTEPLQPGASYRLTATRADGASTTALIVMPADVEIATRHFGTADPAEGGFALLEVRAEQVLFVEMVYTMSTSSGLPSIAIRLDEHSTFPTGVPGTHGIGISGDTLPRDRYPDLVDMRRLEIHLVAGRSDWPYHPGLSDLAVTLPNEIPSNIENGVGFVGGVATAKIPFDYCGVLDPRPDRDEPCKIILNAQSAAIEGRVIREPCGEPHTLADVRLTERFAGGGAIMRAWRTGWDGRYRFEGIESDSDLVLEVPGAPAVELPRLAPGEGYTVSDVSVTVGC